MAAGRVAGRIQPVLVHAVFLGMQPEPAARAQHLLHDLFHRHLGTEVVVDHRQRDAGVDPGGREEGEVLLVERAPVAAMDEHHAAAVALARGEEVDRLPRLIAVAQVEMARHGAARALRGLAPASEVLRVVGDQVAVVVLTSEDRAIGSVHPRFSRQSPIASWPGRSENENKTASPLDSSCNGAHEGTTKVSRGSKSNLSFPITAVPWPSTTE